MAENYYKGLRRIFYRAAAFNDSVIVTANVLKPDLTNNETFTLTKVVAVDGLYYLDYNFGIGEYVMVFFEDGVKSGSQAYDIIEQPGGGHHAHGNKLIN